ncbi:MAG: FHA domain-containing protein [Lachnospiraceae bacterium]|nr:FHA domain-containing protein [Lachnospiraceae bacterium]
MEGTLGAVYEKEWMESYVKIPYELTEDGETDERMIFYAKPEGFLSVEHIVNDGIEYCRYKITGKKSLTAMFQSLPLKEWHIKRILESLIEVVENAKEHLLAEDNIVLMPEYTYVNINDYSAEFMYLPDYGRPLKESIESFLEYLLNRVDYDDKKAVEMIYDCYVLVMKESGGLQQMKERLNENTKPTQNILQGQNDQVIPKRFEEIKQPIESFSWESLEKDEEDYEEKGMGFTEWIRKLFKHREIPKVPIVADNDCNSEYNAPMNSIPIQEESPTVFLAQKKIGATPYLLSISDGSVVRLSTSPFCIGTIKGSNGYNLNREGVSRLHARLYKNHDGWKVADLNSTNGTFVNEQEVFPGKDVSLYNNDKIRFAAEEYIYKEGK